MERPYEWDVHLTTWVTLVIAATVIILGHRRLLRTSEHPIRWTRHDIWLFAGACGASVVALTWPVADLATHWSLTALVIQRLILILAVAPLFLLGLPYDVLEWITRPALVDAVVNRCRRPATAIVVVTVITVGSMVPPVVHAQASSSLLRAFLALAAVIAGLVLWIPVLGRVPGVARLRPMVRFGYLATQAVVPAFLSFVLILSPHPLYTVFAGSKAAIDLRPLNDQQIAGFVSKLTMLIVLLTVGGVGLAKSKPSDEEADLGDQLVWADVQRQFERVDRKSAQGSRETTPSADTTPSKDDVTEHDNPES
jgi:cytochrome c oxidase assembly factor CtaG